jgi:hypothetical protein
MRATTDHATNGGRSEVGECRERPLVMVVVGAVAYLVLYALGGVDACISACVDRSTLFFISGRKFIRN